MNEKEDIIAAKENSLKFEVLYNRYYHDIFKYCFQRSKSIDEAKDFTSQVFLKALQHLQSYEYRNKSFLNWLYTIAHNEVHQSYRQKKRSRVIRTDIQSMSSLFESEDFDENTGVQLLMKALNSMSNQEVDLIEMKYFEHRSHSDISNMLGISEENARVKLHRAIKSLRGEFINQMSKTKELS